MSSTAALVEQLQSQGLTLAVRGDRLRALGPEDVLTPEVEEKLRHLKAEIIALLASRAAWPPESFDYVTRFRCPEARLFPFIHRTISTPNGKGRLLMVTNTLCEVHFAGDGKATRVRWEEIAPG